MTVEHAVSVLGSVFRAVLTLAVPTLLLVTASRTAAITGFIAVVLVPTVWDVVRITALGVAATSGPPTREHAAWRITRAERDYRVTQRRAAGVPAVLRAWW